jgi:CIC family chloride channel protein
MVITAEAYDPGLEATAPLTNLARLRDQTLGPDADIEVILNRFERLQVDDIAVTDDQGHVLGLLTEKYVRRRYAEEIEKTQSSLFGEQARGA